MNNPTLLQVAQLGNKILKKKAKQVNKIEHPDIQELIDNMIATMNEQSGVGIAAPQVYQGHRIFIIASKPNDRYPDAPDYPPFAVVNPEVTDKSEEIKKGWEGCLSIPNLRGLVPRHIWIKMKYYTRDGEEKEEVFTDFLARVIQHEYDHLDGIMFTERMDDITELMSDKEYFKMMAALAEKREKDKEKK